MKKVCCAFLVFCLSLALCACGGKSFKDDIIGEWVGGGGSALMTLKFSEEDCVITMMDMSDSSADEENCSYTVDENKKTVTVKISGQEFTLNYTENENGDPCLEMGELFLRKVPEE